MSAILLVKGANALQMRLRAVMTTINGIFSIRVWQMARSRKPVRLPSSRLLLQKLLRVTLLKLMMMRSVAILRGEKLFYTTQMKTKCRHIDCTCYC